MRQFNIILFSLLLAILFMSCVGTKKYNEVILRRGTQYYKLEHKPAIADSGDPDTIVYKVNTCQKPNKVSISIKDNIIKVTPTLGEPDIEIIKILKGTVSDTTFNKLITKSASNVFPSPIVNIKISNSSDLSKLEQTIIWDTLKSDTAISKLADFKYIESQLVFQAMTVPFKYRKQLNDTIVSQTTSSFNVGFAFGKKISWKKFTQYYRGTQLLNSATNSFSVTPGIFLGPTLISLENGVSVQDPIDLDRTVAGITTGAFLVVGINNFNTGLAIGIDQALGDDGKKWIYQDNPLWWGFVLSFDFIK